MNRAKQSDESAAGRRPRPKRLSAIMAQVPDLLQRVATSFHQITGLSIVGAIASRKDGQALPTIVIPPVHPTCVALSTGLAGPLPCAEEWVRHVRQGLARRRCTDHQCPLGARCACVPLTVQGCLVGSFKLVAADDLPSRDFAAAVEALEALVEGGAQQLQAVATAEELMARRRQVQSLPRLTLQSAGDGRATERSGGDGGSAVRTFAGVRSLARQALEYIREHFADPDLSVSQVAQAIEVSSKYLSHEFARQMGKRMSACVVEWRVRHACELLLTTDWQVKRIAQESGFRDSVQFGRCFRRQVGVSAGEYRRMFHFTG